MAAGPRFPAFVGGGFVVGWYGLVVDALADRTDEGRVGPR